MKMPPGAEHALPPPYLVKLQYSCADIPTAIPPAITGHAWFELPSAIPLPAPHHGSGRLQACRLARRNNLLCPTHRARGIASVQRGFVHPFDDPRDRRAIRLHANREAIRDDPTHHYQANGTSRKSHERAEFRAIEDSIKQLTFIDAAEKVSSRQSPPAK